MQVCHQLMTIMLLLYSQLLENRQQNKREARNYPTYHHYQQHSWGKSCFLQYKSRICGPIGPASTTVQDKSSIKFLSYLCCPVLVVSCVRRPTGEEKSQQPGRDNLFLSFNLKLPKAEKNTLGIEIMYQTPVSSPLPNFDSKQASKGGVPRKAHPGVVWVTLPRKSANQQRC